jgi:ABC-type dipeptide/oligopeptide/nickel transport system permease subunit
MMTLRRIGFWCLLVLLAVAVLAALRPGASYAAQDREAASSAASHRHPAGTDALGRDRLTRVAVASLLGFAGATSASALTTLIAAAVGTLAAFAPALVAWPLLLISDAFLALPWLFLLMMVRAGMPLQTAPLLSAAATFLILALLGWPACARAVYAGARVLRGADWMVQSRAQGLRTLQRLRWYVLPHLLPLLLPQFLISIPAFLIAEANLGTLGLGVAEPLPSWGSMLLELENSALLASSHWVYLPVALLILFLVSLELLVLEA